MGGGILKRGLCLLVFGTLLGGITLVDGKMFVLTGTVMDTDDNWLNMPR